MKFNGITESAALRQLDLPTSRRKWLRAILDHTEIGNAVVYDRSEVEGLREKMSAGTTVEPEFATR